MRRALPLLTVILLGAAACGGPDTRAPFTDSRIPPGLEHRFYPPQGWAWGLVQVGAAPAARYGVSAPPVTPRAQVLILTGYGDPAETWFETARELNARGYVVWVMEPAGQGGSGRYGRQRDLGDAPSLDPDVATLLAFPGRIARDTPLFVLASGASAPAALRAAAMGLRAQGVILSGPAFDPGPAAGLEKARRMRRFGLGGLRAQSHDVWRRDGRDDLASSLTRDPARGKLRLAWQVANPDLRMGGPSWRWRAAFADEIAAAHAGEGRVRMPALVIASVEKAPCGQIAGCRFLPSAGGGADPHLQADEARDRWLQAVIGFIDPAKAALAPALPPATVGSHG